MVRCQESPPLFLLQMSTDSAIPCRMTWFFSCLLSLRPSYPESFPTFQYKIPSLKYPFLEKNFRGRHGITKVAAISLNQEKPYSREWFSLGFAKSKPRGNNQNEILKSIREEGKKISRLKRVGFRELNPDVLSWYKG